MNDLRFEIGSIRKTIDFEFEWDLDLTKISQNVIEVAKLLIEKKLVEVSPELKDGKIQIYANSICNKSFLVNNLLEETINKNNRLLYLASPKGNITDRCSRKKEDMCKFDVCPMLVAGYLYYAENKGISVNTKSQTSKEYIDKISVTNEMKKTLQSFISDYRKDVFCIIECADGIDKIEIIKNISNLLYISGKTTRKEPYVATLKEFANKLIIPKNEVLVIIDLKSQIKANTSSFTEEARLKNDKEELALNRLEELTYQNYVFLLDNKLNLDTFINSRPKFSYLFQDRIIIPDLTDKEIVDGILSKIENRHIVDNIIVSNYIKENRKYLPFKNHQLISYISNYINNQDIFTLPQLLISPKKLENYFDEIIGMNNLKQQLLELRNYLYFNKDNKKKDLRLHMMFLGNPGTGKTTIARIVSHMLFDLGYIESDKMVEVDKKDLVAAYLGQSAIKTSQVIKSALGGVLFIDEAYTLGEEDSYSKEVVGTILKAMEDYSSNLVVIFAGYRKEMQNFLNANSGIESRIAYTFDFSDYSTEELMEIFELKLSKENYDNKNYVLDDLAKKQITYLFNKNRKYTNFGNGRYVDKLLQNVLITHATNCIEDKKRNKNLITIDDIEKENEKIEIDNWLEESFSSFIGMDDIKEKLFEMYHYLQFNNQLRQLKNVTIPTINLHMMFLGGPGTGKTTLARKIAKMLFDLGYIKENKCIEVGKQDIVGQYLGQTSQKVDKLIKSALGGVLFIDEAYSLCESKNGYGKEAMEVIIKSMEDYRDNLIIIFAGYDKEMQDFITMNSGIMSRIGYTFNFKDYETDELFNIFKLKMNEYGFNLDDIETEVKETCNYFKSINNFGNGRFVDKLIQKTLIKHASNNSKDLTLIVKEDIPTISEMIKESIMDEDSMIFPSDITEEDKKQVAYHESGHALAQYLLEHKIDIKEITIIPEGSGTLGYVLHKPEKKAMPNKEDYLNKIKRLLAGRASEEIIYNTFYAGCSSDIEKATHIAYIMTQRLGMTSNLVPIDNQNYKSGIDLQNEIDNEVKNIIQTCYNEVKELLLQNKDLLHSLTKFMLSKNRITGEEFEEFLNKNKE